MDAHFLDCQENLDKAVNDLFDADPQIQAVGIARHGGGFGYKAVKNEARIVPASSASRAGKLPRAIMKIPVAVETVSAEVEAHLVTPHPAAASFIPERQQVRPLVCGLQIQNVDDDARQRKAGALGANLIIIGTLGCFVRLSGGTTAVLSNNHVLAGENRGQKRKDRILQPGSLTFSVAEHIATLTDFVPLNPSPANARPALGTVVYNDVDAAVAELEDGVAFGQKFLAARNLPNPHGPAAPKVGDKVSRSAGRPA